MKKLNLSLLAILITISVMPQSAFSMEQPQDNPTTQSQPPLNPQWAPLLKIIGSGQSELKLFNDVPYVKTQEIQNDTVQGIETKTTWVPLETLVPKEQTPASTTVRYTREPYGKIKHTDYQWKSPTATQEPTELPSSKDEQ